MKTLVTLGLVAGLALATLPASAGTLTIAGSEATGLAVTTEADGSVTRVATASFDGLLADADGTVRVFVIGRAQFTMTVPTTGDELRGAKIVYTQSGRRGVSVTVAIDPCWIKLVNERDSTSEDFAADVREEIEDALPPGTLAPATVLWLEQRLSLLAARIAEPLVKSGTVLVPPQS